MTVELPRGTIVITFKHRTAKILQFKGNGSSNETRRATTVNIFHMTPFMKGENAKDGSVHGTGRWLGAATAKCSPRDNFCYETGRKVALTRALKAVGFSKEDRRLIWKAYFGRKPGYIEIPDPPFVPAGLLAAGNPPEEIIDGEIVVH